MTPAEWVLGGIVALAFLTEAVVGFGSTVMVVSLGAQLLPLEVLLPTYVPVNMLLSAWLVLRHRAHVDTRLLWGRIVPFMVAGMGLAFLVPAGFAPALLLGGFGLLVMALAAPELLTLARPAAAETPPRAPLSLPASALVLGAGGVIHGLFGSGGPLVVYFSGRQQLDKAAFRATLSALWLLLNSLLVGVFAYRGQLDAASLQRSATLLVPLLLGAAVGERLHHRVNVRVFRGLVFGLLFLAGLSLAWRNLLR